MVSKWVVGGRVVGEVFVQREVLSVHIGQCGVQLGNSLWENYCLEHDVQEDGTIGGISDGFSTMFHRKSSTTCSPNAIFVDLEPSVIDGIRLGRFKELFGAGHLITGTEDAASMFPRGFLFGTKIVRLLYDRLRSMIEEFESFQGFMLYRATGGGTGSGLSALLLDTMEDDFTKKTIIEVGVYPSKVSGVIEPYNASFSTYRMFEQVNCSFMVDNEAMYNIARNQLDTDSFNHLKVNEIVARAVCTLTASLRFQGPLNVDLSEFETNLVPFPKLHFPFISFSPITKEVPATFSIQSMTKSCFDSANRMLSVDAENGEYVACCLSYRGDVALSDVNSAISLVKSCKLVKFVGWSPTGFKVGINSLSPIKEGVAKSVCPPASLAMIANSTSIQEVWSALNTRFRLMYQKRAFAYWFYKHGMSDFDFCEAHEAMVQLEQEYKSLTS